MGKPKQSKLNHLQSQLGANEVVSARWLRAHGYSTGLVARYVRSGWLKSPARGIYTAPWVTDLGWESVLRSLQQRDGLRLHVGGRFALAWQGHEHYLRLGESPVITLYGNDRPPGWLAELPMQGKFLYVGAGPFPPTEPVSSDDADAEALYREGLASLDTSSNGEPVVMSTVERAMLELCAAKANTALVLEADALMQGLAGLRSELVQRLLGRCRSVQAKRLFLALAERHSHAWASKLDLEAVDLGRGNRALVEGGRLDRKYQITLPRELDEVLG
ncbi:MAG: type IV toxin-antitoxin system AbiEi family antitoxin [Rhizobium sp.]|nr:type IV toxin-antitoxin system AbiEi family antitoxin [Rhizobium sp.]